MQGENMSKHQHITLGPIFDQITRRGFLGQAVGLIPIGATATFFSGAVPTPALAPPTQSNWRRCEKCNMLFFNGYRDKGRCPAGGRHAVFGRFDYVLVYDDSTGPGQGDWRFCRKCKAIFFNGYPSKGVCPAGDGHEAAGYNFFLFHDRKPTGNEVANWRFCNKCYALFFNNAPATSACAKGDSHEAQGYKFVLRVQGANID
jgi:hypothetical protein